MRVSKRLFQENLLYIFFFTASFLIIFLPILKQRLITPPDLVYTYVHGHMPDYFGYLMVIKQGRSQFAERNQFSTDTPIPSRLHLFYLLLGKFGIFTNLTDTQMYYLGIFISYFLYCVFTCLLIKKILPDKQRFLALFIILLASPFPPFSYNLTLPNKQIALSNNSWWTYMDPSSRLMLVPHHIFSVAIMLGACLFFLLYTREKRIPSLFLTIIFTVLSGIFFPIPVLFFSITIAILMLIKIILRRNEWGGYLLIIISALLTIFYVSKQTAAGYPWSEFVKLEYLRHNSYPDISASIIYILALGILPLLTLAGLPKIIKERKFEQAFIFLMAAVPYFLFNLANFKLIPISKFRFVYSAPYFFWGLLSAIGFFHILSFIHKKPYYTAFYFFGFIVFLFNFILGFGEDWGINLTKTQIPQWQLDYNYYLPQNVFKVLNYLRNSTKPYSNIMTDFRHGSYIVAYTFNNVYVGHDLATLNFYDKNQLTNKFFTNSMTIDEATALLTNNNIEYVYWDNRQYGQVSPSYKNILSPVITTDPITVFAVKTKILPNTDSI